MIIYDKYNNLSSMHSQYTTHCFDMLISALEDDAFHADNWPEPNPPEYYNRLNVINELAWLRDFL